MKITANQNLIPYFQQRRDGLPANQTDEGNRPALNRQPASRDPQLQEQPSHRYYIKQDLENSIYNAGKKIVSQKALAKGMIIDVYA